MVLGLGLVLSPFVFHGFSPWIWRPIYWCGGTLMILGGFLVDLTILGVVRRQLQAAWRHLKSFSAPRGWRR
jgi:uncharacterized membrane protein YbhN (UPF0104 family)